MRQFEVLPSGVRPRLAGSTQLEWKRERPFDDGVISSFGWDLHEFKEAETQSTDLFRIASAAYVADRLTIRGVGFSRTIAINVHVVAPELWSLSALNSTETLLSWLTGDDWKITLRKASRISDNSLDVATDTVDEVVLLSGGLDSFCGAVDRLSNDKRKLFIGHNDGTSAVVHAQEFVRQYIHTASFPGNTSPYITFTIAQKGGKKEATTRSRSLLFMASAVMAASSRNASNVIVPENGYTSINPPLNEARGGALSTRSTHPTTFVRVNELLTQLGLNITVSNPYQSLTKGEFVSKAAATGLSGFEDAITQTLSCGKLDGTYYKGGNPNYACGLCIPCIVRRASILGAGIEDLTSYLCNVLTGDSLIKLQRNRHADTDAMHKSLATTITENDLMIIGPWPDDFDLDIAQALCNRAMDELRLVSLP